MVYDEGEENTSAILTQTNGSKNQQRKEEGERERYMEKVLLTADARAESRGNRTEARRAEQAKEQCKAK